MPKGGKEPLKIYEIQGVGQLQINVANKEINWENTKQNEEVVFYPLEGKSVSGDKNKGAIRALSDDRRFGLLETGVKLSDKQNIMLDIGGDLYAKVINVSEGRYTICFTAKPDVFKAWEESVYKA